MWPRTEIQAPKPIIMPNNALKKNVTDLLYNNPEWNPEALVPYNSECPFVLGGNSTVNPAFDKVNLPASSNLVLGV
jgi:hypothetical protein